VQRVDFDLDRPVTVMVDGESLELQLRSIEVLAGALDVYA
jgi:diacylglycerol kinase family enzyme